MSLRLPTILMALATMSTAIALAPAAEASPLACSELLSGDQHCDYYLVCIGPYTHEWGYQTCRVGVDDPRDWPCTCDPIEPVPVLA